MQVPEMTKLICERCISGESSSSRLKQQVVAKSVEITEKLFDLTGKVALVTGAGRGMGRAFAEAMAVFGADVVATDISLEQAEETVALIKNMGRRAIAVRLDISKEEDSCAAVEAAVKQFGRIDILINNAAIMLSHVDFPKESVADWRHQIDVNLTGPFLVSRAVSRQMIKQKAGSIISMGSSFSSRCSVMNLDGGSPEYVVSKSGVQSLNRAMAQDLAPYGIRCNCIAPGVVDTPVHQDHRDRIMGYVPFFPLGRIQETNDVVGTAIFLASDASCFITGQVIHVNGGMIMVD